MSTRLAKRWTPQDLDEFHKFHGDIKEDVMRSGTKDIQSMYATALAKRSNFYKIIRKDEMRRAARQDLNQPELVLALRKIGAKVYHLRKPLDLLVGYRNRNILMEVKSAEKEGWATEFTKEQIDFIETWPGEIAICHTIDEAISAVVHGAKP